MPLAPRDRRQAQLHESTNDWLEGAAVHHQKLNKIGESDLENTKGRPRGADRKSFPSPGQVAFYPFPSSQSACSTGRAWLVGPRSIPQSGKSPASSHDPLSSFVSYLKF